jgi:uncharacterized protein (DUF488 family)
MYYRRKILLSLMQLVGGTIEKISLQKLLLLFTQHQECATFDFVPYKYGCFSFSSNADLTVMVRKGMLKEDENKFFKLDSTDYVTQLTDKDKYLLREVVSGYGKMTSKELMYTTYIQYPYYATRSELAQNILSPQEYQTVISNIPYSDQTILFTIGYEGISLEEYLNRLLRNNIKVLVDVRNNPLSMKYGFSKSQLRKYCTSLGIEYIHIPEVGIKSEQRQALDTQDDYDRLFEIYRTVNIPASINAQHQIVTLLKQHKRIALTCFEANINQCHRKHLANAIVSSSEFLYEPKHI